MAARATPVGLRRECYLPKGVPTRGSLRCPRSGHADNPQRTAVGHGTAGMRFLCPLANPGIKHEALSERLSIQKSITHSSAGTVEQGRAGGSPGGNASVRLRARFADVPVPRVPVGMGLAEKI